MTQADLYDLVQSIVIARGYKFFTGANYDLNLVGFRSAAAVAGNLFDDAMACAYLDDKGAKCCEVWPITTDPGTYYLRFPENPRGTAIVVPGQYRGLWHIGLHHGEYEALTQVGEVAVYRDASRDDVATLDPKLIQRGVFGINGHRAGESSTRVDRWSAGCQVHARRRNFVRMMALAYLQVQHHPQSTTFTYTLIDASEDSRVASVIAAAA